MNIATGRPMNLWTSVFLSFLFCLSAEAKCDFKPYLTKIYSLSGPVTVVLKEMGQLKNPRLKGISIFHPVKAQEFSGRILPGGVFMSQEIFAEFSGGVVFYDESRELNKILGTLSSIQSREMVTRNLFPREVVTLVIKELREFMVGCDKEFEKVITSAEDLEKKILDRLSRPMKVNFYVGEFRQGRPPELIMANDGLVKWLRQQKKIVTYPSDLPYVNWSAKILQKMAPDTLQVALKDSGQKMTEQYVQTSENITFIYPGILIPGLSQLEGFLSFFEKVQR